MLAGFGIDISKRQLTRLLIADQDVFLAEASAVLRTGLETASWITVDDTGARHKANNGVCAQIGNDGFTSFTTTGSKSRLNFLELLGAGDTTHLVNDAALANMREHNLSGPCRARSSPCSQATRRGASPTGPPGARISTRPTWPSTPTARRETSVPTSPAARSRAARAPTWAAIAATPFSA
jgi:hypothetical protein